MRFRIAFPVGLHGWNYGPCRKNLPLPLVTIKKRGVNHLAILLTATMTLIGVLGSHPAVASPVTVVREYTYHAGDADSKLTCRAVALEQVKRLLLEELGTYLISNTIVKDATLTKDEVITYSAGVVATVVIEERWNGEEYYMKAKITADADEVAKSVAAMRDDQEKTTELNQLRTQASESLKEIERLRKELAAAKASNAEDNATKVSSIQEDYDREVERLTAKDYLEQGIRLRKVGTLDDAIAAFSNAITTAPGWYRPYVTRGATYILASQNDNALMDIEKALQLNPLDTTATGLHGIVLLKLSRGDEGVAELGKVAAASPRDGNVAANIGGILVKYKLPTEAISFLNHAIDLKTNDRGRSYFLRAQAYSQLGDNKRAVADLRTAARLGNPKAIELLRRSAL